jgi:hypothetical protein
VKKKYASILVWAVALYFGPGIAEALPANPKEKFDDDNNTNLKIQGNDAENSHDQ